MDVKVPQLAEAVTEGDIGRWLKKDGDRVEKDEALVELETDKATVEIAAEVGGTLEILKQEGETVSVGDVIARIGEGDEAPQAAREPKEEPERKAEKAEPKEEPEPKAEKAKPKEEPERKGEEAKPEV